jgi:hypothetical protein
MSDDTEYRARDPLIGHLDQAAEQMRQANHHTYTAREVTDLYPVVGALHALFARFDQLAGYLLATVAQTDPADLRHDDDGDIAAALAGLTDGLRQARAHTAHTTRAIDGAWQELSHLAPAPRELTCPECGEPAYRGIPTDLTPSQRAATVRPRHRHADGTQLCPVLGEHGYQPATPITADPATPCTTGTTTSGTNTTCTTDLQ